MSSELAARFQRAWEDELAAGFTLGDPAQEIETRFAHDPATGVEFRFRWLPHRELRFDSDELERRGILDPQRDHRRLYRDPRDPTGRHCYLCPHNVSICHPTEILIPLEAGGRSWQAGANFAWLGPQHFTVMSADHEDQAYEIRVLEAMLDLHARTDGAFRLVFNGPGAGATIPWHLHFQIVGEPFPVEGLLPGAESSYPVPLLRLPGSDPAAIDRAVTDWRDRNPVNHSVNLLVAGVPPMVFVVLRDARRQTARNKGLMGGWEVAGDFAYSEPGRRGDFETADLSAAREALSQIRPPAAPAWLSA